MAHKHTKLALIFLVREWVGLGDIIIDDVQDSFVNSVQIIIGNDENFLAYIVDTPN